MENARRWIFPGGVWLALAFPPPLLAQAEQEQALEAVRTRIEALEQRLARDNAERDARSEELRRVELDASAAARELARLRARIAEQQARERALAESVRNTGQRLDAELAVLTRQLRASYMSGRAEIFKLLLSQEDPADLGRMVAYYDYLLRARGERLDSTRAELRTLAELADESERVRRSLAELERSQAAEHAALAASREERQTVVARLEDSIAAGGAEIEQLREEEGRLVELVTELGELLAGFPVNVEEPFAGVRGRLAWPVAGQVAGDFGRPRNGGPMRWNGVLLEAGEGTSVRAVYHGRVVFSDWLPGLGLLMILDHGDGYMSLYGHNEALLKEAGDWAAPGEVIAQVGDTGGLARPSLYFEIREHGAPVNPHGWFAAPPAGTAR